MAYLWAKYVYLGKAREKIAVTENVVLWGNLGKGSCWWIKICTTIISFGYGFLGKTNSTVYI